MRLISSESVPSAFTRISGGRISSPGLPPRRPSTRKRFGALSVLAVFLFNLGKTTQEKLLLCGIMLACIAASMLTVGFVKNNGPEAAQFVEVTALLFKDGVPVGVERTYAVVTDSEINPGEEASFKCSSYTDFDTAEFYLDSRGDFQIKS